MSFAVGDFVRWKDGHRKHGPTRYGVLSRVGEQSMTAIPDGGGRPVVFRRQKYGQPWLCSYLSPAEMAMKRWMDQKPSCEIVTASWFTADSMLAARLQISVRFITEPEQLYKAATEMIALRNWLAVRPLP